MAKAATKDVVKAEDEKNLSAQAMEAAGIDIFDDAGLGSEDVGSEDVIIPRIKLVQKLSDEMKRTHPNYMPEVKEGEMLNTATRQIYGDNILIIPCKYQKRYIEWTPITAGGGLVNPDHTIDILAECNYNEDDRSYMLPNGNEVVETPEFFVLIVDPETGSIDRAVLSMAGTKSSIARQLNTLVTNLKILNPKTGQLANPASFYGVYNLTSVPVSNDKGEWMNFKVEYAGPIPEFPWGPVVYQEAKDFYMLIREGAVQADVGEEERAARAKPVGPTDSDAM